MRKILLLAVAVVVVVALVLGISTSSCKKAPTEGTPTEVPQLTPEATATPEPTAEPVLIEIADETPSPEEAVAAVSTELRDLVISDADVDAVMIEDVHAWPGFSVKDVVYDGQQTIFYVIPDDVGEDIESAIGEVVMSFNNDMVNSLNCKVYLHSIKKNEDKIKKLYDYFLNTFPIEVVGNLNQNACYAIRDIIHMDFESAAAAAASGTETRDLCGQFVFHVASSLISFDFYVE